MEIGGVHLHKNLSYQGTGAALLKGSHARTPEAVLAVCSVQLKSSSSASFSYPLNTVNSMGSCISTVYSRRVTEKVTPPTKPAPLRPPSLNVCGLTAIDPYLNIPQLKLPLSIFDHGPSRSTFNKGSYGPLISYNAERRKSGNRFSQSKK